MSGGGGKLEGCVALGMEISVVFCENGLVLAGEHFVGFGFGLGIGGEVVFGGRVESGMRLVFGLFVAQFHVWNCGEAQCVGIVF